MSSAIGELRQIVATKDPGRRGKMFGEWIYKWTETLTVTEEVSNLVLTQEADKNAATSLALNRLMQRVADQLVMLGMREGIVNLSTEATTKDMLVLILSMNILRKKAKPKFTEAPKGPR